MRWARRSSLPAWRTSQATECDEALFVGACVEDVHGRICGRRCGAAGVRQALRVAGRMRLSTRVTTCRRSLGGYVGRLRSDCEQVPERGPGAVVRLMQRDRNGAKAMLKDPIVVRVIAWVPMARLSSQLTSTWHGQARAGVARLRLVQRPRKA